VGAARPDRGRFGGPCDRRRFPVMRSVAFRSSRSHSGNGGFARRDSLHIPSQDVQEFLDREWRAPLVVVVDVDVGQDLFPGVRPDDFSGGLEACEFRRHDPVPDLVRFPFNLEPVAAVQADELEVRALRRELLKDLGYRRHVISVQVNKTKAVFLEELEKDRRVIIRVADFDGVLKSLGSSADKRAETVEKDFFGRHFLPIQVFKLKHDGPELPAERGEDVEEPAEKSFVEIIGVRPAGEGCGAWRLFGVKMGQSQRVRGFDRKDETFRNALFVNADGSRLGEPGLAGEKAPEPLIDFDGIQNLGIVAEVVVRPVMFARLIDEALPGIVFPGACSEAQQALEFGWDLDGERHSSPWLKCLYHPVHGLSNRLAIEVPGLPPINRVDFG